MMIISLNVSPWGFNPQGTLMPELEEFLRVHENNRLSMEGHARLKSKGIQMNLGKLVLQKPTSHQNFYLQV